MKNIYILKCGMDFKTNKKSDENGIRFHFFRLFVINPKFYGDPRPLLPPLERIRTQLNGAEESTSHGTR